MLSLKRCYACAEKLFFLHTHIITSGEETGKGNPKIIAKKICRGGDRARWNEGGGGGTQTPCWFIPLSELVCAFFLNN